MNNDKRRRISDEKDGESMHGSALILQYAGWLQLWKG